MTPQLSPIDEVSTRLSVNGEALNELLARGAEGQDLDFKSECDLSLKQAQIELARDIACMAVKGGHIVIGALDDGTPSGAVTDSALALLDEASVQQQMARWLPDGVRFTIGRHARTTPEGVQRFAIIAVQPDDIGLVVMRADGQYGEGRGQNTIFREGDVLGRFGTRNGRLTQFQIREIFRRAMEREVAKRREEWRADNALTTTKVIQESIIAAQLANSPAASVTWQLPLTAMQQAATEMLRRGDADALRILLISTPKTASAAVRDSDPELTVEELIDRITTLAAVAATCDHSDAFTDAIRALTQVYAIALDSHGRRRNDLTVPATIIWRSVLERVEALGGLLIRLGRFGLIPDVVMAMPAEGEIEFYGNWLRHGLTEAARSGRFADIDEEGNHREVNLLNRALDVAQRLEALLPDVAQDDEALLNSICQFDAVAALVAMHAAEKIDTRYFFPNFANFYAQRTLPILSRVSSTPALRAELGLVDPAFLADAMRHMLEVAQREDWMRTWDWELTPIGAFIQQYGTQRP